MTNATTFGDDRLPARFWKKAQEAESGCWLWTAATHRKGYGQFYSEGSMKQAHRVAYAALVGAIRDDLQLDHQCRVRHCVNPAHLAAVTNKENAENRAAVNRFGRPRGVYYDDGKWFGRAVHDGRAYYTGYYDDPERVAVEVVALRNKIFTNNVTDRAG